jgi:hypothetical protein
MPWKVYCDTYTTSAFSNGEKTIRARFNKNVILKACRTWVVFVNEPVVTDFKMEIWTDNNNSKGIKLYDSLNTLTKSEIITLENGVKEIYFEFDDLPFDGDIYYHFVLTGSGASFSDTSLVAWMKGWPDPVYREGLTINYENLLIAPYTIYFIGAEL